MKGQPIFFGPLLYFRTLPALEHLSSAQLGSIAQHAEEEFFPAGSSLLQPQRPREAFFVIVEGKVTVRGPGGLEGVVGPGEAVGFLHLLARSDEELEARALWDTVALRVDWDAHLDVCERSFPILEAHIGFLAQGCQEELDRIRASGAEVPKPPDPSAPLAGGEAPDRRSGPAVEEPMDEPSGLNMVQRLRALHRSRAFPSSNMDALAELTRHLVEVRLEPDREIWTVGEKSEEFLLVVSGGVVREAPGGAWRQEFHPGDVVGRFEALSGLPRRSILRALDPTVALAVRLEPLLDILEDHFTMAVDFTAELAQELIQLSEVTRPQRARQEIL
jgi:CRP-like cAMP-binding protein